MQHTHRALYPVVIEDKHGVVFEQPLLLIWLPASGIFDKIKQYSASGNKCPIDFIMFMPVISKGKQFVPFL